VMGRRSAGREVGSGRGVGDCRVGWRGRGCEGGGREVCKGVEGE